MARRRRFIQRRMCQTLCLASLAGGLLGGCCPIPESRGIPAPGKILLTQQGGLYQVVPATGEEQRIAPVVRDRRSVVLSQLYSASILPDGRRFLARTDIDRVLGIFDADGRLLEASPWGLDGKDVKRISLSPDGSHVAYFETSERLMVRNLGSGTVWSPQLELSTDIQPTWIASDVLLVHSPGQVPHALDVESGAASAFGGGRLYCAGPFGQRGRALCGGREGELLEVEPHSGERREIARLPQTMSAIPCRSPDGRWLAYVADSGCWTFYERSYSLYVYDYEARELHRMGYVGTFEPCVWVRELE